VVDEGKNPSAETAACHKAVQAVNGFEAGFLADILCRGWIATGTFGTTSEGRPVEAKQTIERFDVAGLGVLDPRSIVYSRIEVQALCYGRYFEG